MRFIICTESIWNIEMIIEWPMHMSAIERAHNIVKHIRSDSTRLIF